MNSAAGTQTDEGAGVARASARKGRQPTADDVVAEVRNRLGEDWPPRIYRERILPTRTRSHALPALKKGAAVEVQHTLLGIELKVGRRRLSCPDLATARYLAVFARAGVGNVAVPYDITKISHLADVLESAWQRMLLLADFLTEGRNPSVRTRARTGAAKEARAEIEEAGAGAAIPQFNQNTSQRRERRAS